MNVFCWGIILLGCVTVGVSIGLQFVGAIARELGID
jgi:hypothetical protein